MAQTVLNEKKVPNNKRARLYWMAQINPETSTNYTEEEAVHMGRSYNPMCIEYWIRTVGEEHAQEELDKWYQARVAKSKQTRATSGKVYRSPMQIQFWLNKVNPDTGNNYTEEEARIHIKSFRKNSVYYWINKINPDTGNNYTEEEAKIKVSEYQKDTSAESAKYRSEHPEIRNTNIAYWLAKGYSEEEARIKQSERQRTFSLEKCIAKYGEEEGRRRWQERQDKWQACLKSLPPEEIARINSMKSFVVNWLDPNKPRDEEFFKQWKVYCENSKLQYFTTKEEAKELFHKRLVHMTDRIAADTLDEAIDIFLNDNYYCPYYYLHTIPLDEKEVREWIRNDIRRLWVQPNKMYRQQGLFNAAYMPVPEGTLRSSNEIRFYEACKKFNVKIDGLDKRYPNSNFRYDFKIDGKYIEIAGLMDHEEYYSKMQYKKATFGSIILFEDDDYEDFVQKVLVEKDESRTEYYNSRFV